VTGFGGVLAVDVAESGAVVVIASSSAYRGFFDPPRSAWLAVSIWEGGGRWRGRWRGYGAR